MPCSLWEHGFYVLYEEGKINLPAPECDFQGVGIL